MNPLNITQAQETSKNIPTLITGVVNNVVLPIAAALALVYLVYSGILYLTAAGNPDAAKKGQQGVVNAVIGIIVIVIARVIISAVAQTAKSVQ